jgi:uncharacterized membrane protein
MKNTRSNSGLSLIGTLLGIFAYAAVFFTILAAELWLIMHIEMPKSQLMLRVVGTVILAVAIILTYLVMLSVSRTRVWKTLTE